MALYSNPFHRVSRQQKRERWPGNKHNPRLWFWRQIRSGTFVGFGVSPQEKSNNIKPIARDVAIPEFIPVKKILHLQSIVLK